MAGGHLIRIGTVTAALVAVAVLPAPAPPVDAADMCDPITLADVHPELYGESTTTTPETTEASDTTTSGSTPTTSGEASDTTTPAPTTTTEPCTPFVKSIHSPLPYSAPLGSGLGAERDGGRRHHEGLDLSVPKMTPVFAAADGVITSFGSEGCCVVTLLHDDGWISRYVHLNNDRFPTDDGAGVGIAPWLAVGDRVEAGDVLGWVGDSTNAEETVAHLHFELRKPDGTAIDAAASFREAEGRDDAFVGAFVDDDELPAAPFLDRAASVGAVWPCDERGVEVCPTELLDPERAERLVERLTGVAVAAPGPPPIDGLDVEAGTRPTDTTPRPITTADLLAMLAEGRRLATLEALDLSALHADLELTTEDTPDVVEDGVDEPRLAVGCLWQTPPDERELTLAEAVVTALVDNGDADVPECDFRADI